MSGAVCVCVRLSGCLSLLVLLGPSLFIFLYSLSESLILAAFGDVAVWACCCCHHVHKHNLIFIICQIESVHGVSVISQVNVETKHVQLLLFKHSMAPGGKVRDCYG